jgi:hypothetical protein
MKKITTIAFLGLFLCGCSHKQTASDRPAIDQVVAGKNMEWGRDVVLHVEKRAGTNVEGVRLILPRADGQKGVITAETGTLIAGSDLSSTDSDCVRITLYNPKGVNTNEVTFVLHKK